ncbi:hypothetical protein CIW52_06700 [Mycolicibacterium sp. P9-64]|nr:hypothetical protein CIW52_06700 [Mycolicibacterium sp. P9-64]
MLDSMMTDTDWRTHSDERPVAAGYSARASRDHYALGTNSSLPLGQKGLASLQSRSVDQSARQSDLSATTTIAAHELKNLPH